MFTLINFRVQNKCTTVAQGSPTSIPRALKDHGAFLRIEVLGGGCSGFQYNMNLVQGKNEDDFSLEHLGATVIIDPTSLDLIEHSVLDYVETLGNAAFEMRNPNATAQCGCGNSFSV